MSRSLSSCSAEPSPSTANWSGHEWKRREATWHARCASLIDVAPGRLVTSSESSFGAIIGALACGGNGGRKKVVIVNGQEGKHEREAWADARANAVRTTATPTTHLDQKGHQRQGVQHRLGALRLGLVFRLGQADRVHDHPVAPRRVAVVRLQIGIKRRKGKTV